MWNRTNVAVLAIILVGGSAAVPQIALTPPRGEPPLATTVRIEEIGTTIRVLGTLGVSLREVVSVHGTWMELTDGPAKPGSTLWFRVTELNGQQLAKPVGFRDIDVKVVEKGGKSIPGVSGERWELGAYETWPDYGHPADFVKEMGEWAAAPRARGSTRLIGLLKIRKAN